MKTAALYFSTHRHSQFVKHRKPMHQFKWVWQKSIEFFCVFFFPHRHCGRPGSGSAPWWHPWRHHLQHLQWEQIPFFQHQLQYRSVKNPICENGLILKRCIHKLIIKMKNNISYSQWQSVWPTSLHYWCFHRWNLGTELKWPGFWGYSKTPSSGEGWNYIFKLLHGSQPDSSGCQWQPTPIPAAELCGLYAWSTGLWFSYYSGKGSLIFLFFFVLLNGKI